MLKNVYWSSCKVPFFWYYCNETRRFLTYFRKILKHKISWKSVKWDPSCCVRMNGRTDMTRLIAAFRNFVNDPKKVAAARTTEPASRGLDTPDVENQRGYLTCQEKWLSCVHRTNKSTRQPLGLLSPWRSETPEMATVKTLRLVFPKQEFGDISWNKYIQILKYREKFPKSHQNHGHFLSGS